MPTIEAGQPVPDFTLPRDGGGDARARRTSPGASS